MLKVSDKKTVPLSKINAAHFNRFCAIIAMAVLCVLFARRTPNFYASKFNQLKSSIESSYANPTKEVFLKNLFWDYLKITNRKSANGIIIMNDGRLVHEKVSNPPLLSARADVIIEFNEYLQSRNIPFLFLRAPDPMRDNADMPKGFENTVIEDSARFISMLNESGVNTLDLRAEMTKDFTDWSETFYWGDHHWNAETALWAYGEVGHIMNRDYGFQLDARTWNPQEYEHITYHKAFVGSASEQAGMIKEDITVLIPKFDTQIAASDVFKDKLISGSYLDVFVPKAKSADSLLFSQHDLNTVDTGFAQYRNDAASEHKKILIIADSFGRVISTYFSCGLEQVDYLYLTGGKNHKPYLEDLASNMYSVIEKESYDLVLLLTTDWVILWDGKNIEHDRLYLGEPPH